MNFTRKKTDSTGDSNIDMSLLLDNNSTTHLSSKDRFKTNNWSSKSNDNSTLPLSDITPQLIRKATITGEKEGYQWDLIIALPNPKSSTDHSMEMVDDGCLTCEELYNKLTNIGLQVFVFRTAAKDSLIMKVRFPMEKLKIFAEHQGFRLRVDDVTLAKKIDNRSSPISFNREISPYHPYEFIHMKYSADKASYFVNAHGYKHPFSDTTRIKIIMDAIRCNDHDPKFHCGVDLGMLKENGSILTHFTLHDDEKRDDLSRMWFALATNPWQQPIDEIRDYFGEKIALYFEFLGHYTTWLLYLCFISVFTIIATTIELGILKDFSEVQNKSVIIPFYTFFVCLWAQLMIEYWKRKQVIKSMEWGTTEFEEEERQRAKFYGEKINSCVNGEKILYFSDQSRKKLSIYSNCIISGMIMIVIACVSIIFYIQFYAQTQIDDDKEKMYVNSGASLCLAIQIQILNLYYGTLAESLTERENHRTDTDYEDSLIGKLFAFNFVNSYASLFYIAFIKQNIGGSCENGCMIELAMSLGIIFTTRLVVSKCQTFFSLYANNKKKKDFAVLYYQTKAKRRESLADDRSFSKCEESMMLEYYDPMVDTLNNYSELIVQYGYVTLFVGSFPFAPLFAYVSNIVEFRTDGWQLLYMMKRPIPTGAEDIGTWLSILQIISYTSVVTNAALICFTMNLFEASPQGLVWIFIGFQYIILMFMQAFDHYIDDVPPEVLMQLERQDYLTDRADNNMNDEEDTQSEDSNHTKLNVDCQLFEIHENDKDF